jgi:hypothetical protein
MVQHWGMAIVPIGAWCMIEGTTSHRAAPPIPAQFRNSRVMSTTANLEDFRHELSVLTKRVESVEAQLARNGNRALPPLELAPDILAKVRAITQEIFPGKCEFTSELDPEYPEDRYVVVNVEATGEVQEIVDRGEVWHDRIRQVWPELWDTLRLSIDPR